MSGHQPVPSGHATVRDLLADALHRLRRPLAPTLVAILISAAGAIAVFATTGLALANQQQTINRFNSPTGRLITLTDAQDNAGLQPATIDMISGINNVEWVMGVTSASTITNAALPGTPPVTARTWYGNLPAAIERDNTRTVIPGQAIASHDVPAQLDMASGAGPLAMGTQPITLVGTYTAHPPLDSLTNTVLVRGAPTDTTHHLLTIWISVRNISVLPQVTAAVQAAIIATNPGSVHIDTASELTSLSATVSQGLAHSAQRTVTGLLGAIVVLIGAVQFGRVTAMARDIGRRRALGANRSTIIIGVLLNAALCGGIGAITGVTTGSLLTHHLAGALPPPDFIAGVGLLDILAATIGAIIPAIRAARLDPVRILRVP